MMSPQQCHSLMASSISSGILSTCLFFISTVHIAPCWVLHSQITEGTCADCVQANWCINRSVKINVAMESEEFMDFVGKA